MKRKYYNIYGTENNHMYMIICTNDITAVNKEPATILFDTEDFDKISKHCWRLNETGYVITSIKGHKVRIHNLILNRDTSNPNIVCDHINRNKLDNRKENLRIVTQKENNKNRNNINGAKHYSFDKKRKKYIVNIKENYKTIHIGYYNTIEEAQNAYNHYRENR